MTNVLSILDSTGDTAVLWDVESPEEIAIAEAKFNEIKANFGHLSYKTDADGKNAEVIHEFDASAPQIVMSPVLVGG